MAAQTAYTGGIFDHHEVSITSQSNCSVSSATTTYQTASLSFALHTSCRGAAIDAQVSLGLPTNAPDVSVLWSSGQFLPPLPAYPAEISGKWTIPQPPDSYGFYSGTVSSFCGDSKPSTVPSGNTNFTDKRTCTWRSNAGDVFADAKGNIIATFKSYGQLMVQYVGNGVTYATFEVLSVYVYGGSRASGNDKDQPPPPASPLQNAAPTPTDTTFVVSSGPGLNTGCTFRSAGALNITVPITRYVGETGDDGFLVDSDTLASLDLISRTARLSLLAWDVDSDILAGNTGTTGNQIPELDAVTVNGFHPVASGSAYLTGANGKWRINEFEFPISSLKFPKRGQPEGTPPDPALNTVRVDIDTLNSTDRWCTSVAWASLSINALAPLMLVHGTNADHTTWEIPVGDIRPLDALSHVVFDYNIDLLPNGTPDQNAAILKRLLTQKLTSLGARSCHLITHSKGATDSRRMLSSLYLPGEPFTVLTLFSLGTPSRGTALSDYAVEFAKTTGWRVIDDPILNDGISNARKGYWGGWIRQAPVDPALSAQTTAAMDEFNKANQPVSDVLYFSLAGNADTNGDGMISYDEAIPLFPTWAPASMVSSQATRLYQVLGRTVHVDYVPILGVPVATYHIIGTVADTTEPNDMTSVASSVHCRECGFTPLPAPAERFPGFPSASRDAIFPYNHSAMKNAVTLGLILDKIRDLFPVVSP